MHAYHFFRIPLLLLVPLYESQKKARIFSSPSGEEHLDSPRTRKSRFESNRVLEEAGLGSIRVEIDRSSRTVFFQLDWEVWREKASVERGEEKRVGRWSSWTWKSSGRFFRREDERNVPYRSKGNRLTKSLDKKPIDQFILFYFIFLLLSRQPLSRFETVPIRRCPWVPLCQPIPPLFSPVVIYWIISRQRKEEKKKRNERSRPPYQDSSDSSIFSRIWIKISRASKVRLHRSFGGFKYFASSFVSKSFSIIYLARIFRRLAENERDEASYTRDLPFRKSTKNSSRFLLSSWLSLSIYVF